MGLFVRQDENRSQLQERLAAEMQERARARRERPDGVDDAEFLKGTKQTTSLAPIWAIIIVVALGLAIWAVVGIL